MKSQFLFSARAWLVTCAIVASTPGSAQDARHLGVASCASSLCHGSAKPGDAHPVQQNEYVTWSHFDPHARAYNVLLEPRSQAIAQRLGIGSAHEATVCLNCHADNVPAQQRGPRFQISDGVGCESCHGAAEFWIASHYDTPRLTHADTLKNGLYPIEQPEARAQACASCHLSNTERFADHPLMAAGHPRLSFELGTFTELWRASGGREHFRRDADYVKRKPVPAASEVWLAGLFEAASAQLKLLRSRHFLQSGPMPDFALYNCYSCHRSMRFNSSSGGSGERGLAAGLAPGALRLDDSRWVMLSAVFAAVSPADNADLRARTAQLHAAASMERQQTAAAAEKLEAALKNLKQRLAAKPPTTEQKKQILEELVRGANRGDYPDYVAAEQAAMAIVLLLAETGRDQALKPQIDALFAALAQDDRYDAARFKSLLSTLKHDPD